MCNQKCKQTEVCVYSAQCSLIKSQGTLVGKLSKMDKFLKRKTNTCNAGLSKIVYLAQVML